MIPLKSLIIVFGGLLAGGTALTIPLFKFNYSKFVRSSLFIKIVFWIPIFLVFLGVLYASNGWRLGVLALILLASLVELGLVANTRPKRLAATYYLLFALGMAHFYKLQAGYPAKFINILITLALATVLADVAAFFMGNYAGCHKLPIWLNNRKSYQGVAGEIIGALAGVLLVNWFIVPVVSLWIFVPIGVGSVIGDLTNSFVKRKLDIKDWSHAIPGHGGFLDRFSSLAGSVPLTYIYFRIFGF